MNSELISRDQVKIQDRWNVESIYPDESAWRKDFDSLKNKLTEISEHKGKLGLNAANLAQVFKSRDDLDRVINKLWVYAHLRADEDTSNSKNSGIQDEIHTQAVTLGAELSWIEPEIFKISEKRIQELLKSPELKPYLRLMELILRQRPHTLSEAEENLLTLSADPLATSEKTFSQLSNADLRFPTIRGENNQEVRITHGNYTRLLESKDRSVRKAAFEGVYDTYAQFRNTYASLIQGNVKHHVFLAKARKHPSALEAALFEDNVPKSVYENLIHSIHRSLPIYHRYLELRKKVLSLSDINAWDMYVSIVPDFDLKVSYEESQRWIEESVLPLGKEYQSILRTAFKDRWIDVYENKGKRSGAYSSGCYDTLPFILMNYQNNLNSAFTLAHELGHSMHSYLSRKNQPSIYSNYRILVAEVASTTNESLLTHHLLKTSHDKKLRAYLLSHLCDEFRGTIFRQTMFAEFEKWIYDQLESGKPLTADSLSESYYELASKYHGSSVKLDDRIRFEWARIPHFYYYFYVYKYATGFASAQAFSSAIVAGDSVATEKYLTFLKSGCTKDPLDLLSDAGVDLRKPEPITNAMKVFESTVNELEKTLKEI